MPEPIRIESESSMRDSLDHDSDDLGPSISKRTRQLFDETQDYGSENKKLIEYVRSTLANIPSTVKNSLVASVGRSPYSGLTYSQLGNHIISVRTEYIQKLARPILIKYYTHPRNFNIFNEPVDPVAQNLPYYFDLVKEPMDLGTIKCRLNSAYYESLSDCLRDIRLVFTNAILFNGIDSFVGKLANELLTDFDVDIAALEDKSVKNVSIPHPRRRRFPSSHLTKIRASQCSRKSAHSCSLCVGSLCRLCGEKCLKLETASFFCQGPCAQRVKKNSIYFVSKDALNVWCQKCHQSLPSLLGTYVDPDDPQTLSTLYKKDLLKRRYDEQTSEPWVECDKCGHWYHQICALYTDAAQHSGGKFQCPLCVLDEVATSTALHPLSSPNLRSPPLPALIREVSEGAMDIESEENASLSSVVDLKVSSTVGTVSPLVQATAVDNTDDAKPCSARSLPVTCLSAFLEAMIQELLCAYGHADAARSVSIRVTSNIERRIDVSQAVQEFSKQMYGATQAASIPYRQKCIQLYQEIDGVSVVLFSLYVHEFDKDCPAPNTSTVYLAYLDSVDYFRPTPMRSFVYQEIVVGYLLWAKQRGFKQCNIWACPPQRGDNFIFWCHPSHQKTPTRDRLNAWYHSILARAKYLGIHNGVAHLWNTYFAKLPIRGDFGTREASKRSLTSTASSIVSSIMPKKYSKSSKGGRNAVQSSAALDAESDESCKNLPFPPIFEGDYWILELTRLYNSTLQRVKAGTQQQTTSFAKNCQFIISCLYKMKLAEAFREPVDPIALNIPSYHSVITRPMDLGTVREKLRTNQYITVFDFAEDVRLIFENAKRFNPPGHPVHLNADSLLKDFERRLSELIQETRQLRSLTMVSSESGQSCGKEEDDQLLRQCLLVSSDSTTASDDSSSHRKPKRPRDSLESSPATASPPSGESMTTNSPSAMAPKSLESSDEGHGVAQQSPTSVSAGRQEELFLGDAHIVPDPISTDIDPLVERHQGQEREQEQQPAHTVTINSVQPTTTPTAGTSLNPTLSVQSFVSDLCKSIQRLNDDLFVVRFSSEPISNSNERPSYWEERPSSANSSVSGVVSSGASNSAAQHKRKVTNLYQPTHCLQLLRHLPSDTSDPDPLTANALVDSRHTFLEMSQFRHMQFDTLRRAKHSSLTLLYHQLHHCDKRCGPLCSVCGERCTAIRWHCELCPGFEVCHGCMLKKAPPAASTVLSTLPKSTKKTKLSLPTPPALDSHGNSNNMRREMRPRRDHSAHRDDCFVYTPITPHHHNHSQPLNAQGNANQILPSSPVVVPKVPKTEAGSSQHSSNPSTSLPTSEVSLPPLDICANDFGLLPGHPHVLTPFRVSYR